MEQDRYQRGWEKLGEINADARRSLLEAVEGVAPDLARYVI